jgi:hypothetical protein
VTAADQPITPGERRELRAVVRQQMKVLRTEVKQRQLELVAEAEARLVEKYRDEDRLSDELGQRLTQITNDANIELRKLLSEYEQILDGRWRRYSSGYSTPSIFRNKGNREQLREALIAGIKAQVQQAQLSLDRQEADLLKELAMDSLETNAARQFLAKIPTVGELVPSRRLREIETAFDSREPGQERIP